VARVNLVVRAMPDLEFPPLDGAAMLRALASAFEGITLVKEAQSADLKPHFRRHLAPEQLGWLDELLPLSIPAIAADERPLKLSYLDPVEDEDELPVPSVQVKLNDCWGMKEHPRVAEGRVPVRLWLMSPDGKRLDGTTDFPAWKASAYPKIRAAIRAKYPGFTWP
jgi:ATP-dependent helicase HrpB